MFDLLTKILDRGKKDKDAALVQYVEQATGLWTDMMMEEHDHDQKCIENVHRMQEDCNTMLTESLSILEGIGVVLAKSVTIDVVAASLADVHSTAPMPSIGASDESQVDTLKAENAVLQSKLAEKQAELVQSNDESKSKVRDAVDRLDKAEKDAAIAQEEIKKLSAEVQAKTEEIKRLELLSTSNLAAFDDSAELEKLRAELLQAREDAKSKDAEVAEFKQQLIQSSNALSGVADEETNGQSAPARALNLNLQRAKELVNMTIENVAKEHLTNHTSVISAATQGTNTTVGLSFDDMTAKVTGVMVGGPAFNSKKINKDDVIVKIDGQQVQGNQVLDLLRGSDQPGSVVEITLKRTSVSAFMIWNAASAAA